MEQNLNSKESSTKDEVLEIKENVDFQQSLNKEDNISFNNIIKITYPVIISMFSMNIMIFIDRAFVAKCNLIEFAATMPASNLSTTLGSVFTGIIGCCSVLISQYYGAKKYKNCSSAIWQGIYLSVIFSALLLISSPFTSNIFKLMGHSGDLLKYEVQFFYFIILANCIQFFGAAFSSFYRSIGDTKIIMFVGIIANIINIIFDWLLIFGNLGFPKLGGIIGSGSATVISCIISVIYIYFYLIKIYTKTNMKFFQIENLIRICVINYCILAFQQEYKPS